MAVELGASTGSERSLSESEGTGGLCVKVGGEGGRCPLEKVRSEDVVGVGWYITLLAEDEVLALLRAEVSRGPSAVTEGREHPCDPNLCLRNMLKLEIFG